MSRIVDLSMPVHRDMVTFPRINPPQMLMFDTWEDFARGVGADKYGVDKLTASYTIIQSDHAGTHMDAVKHIRPGAGGPESIPLEYCFSDGVVLDFRHKE
ncbi:MAG TPA: cyclase family protein, partial [Rubrobacteraceae bacterium]|nr:cyclase family protein [Rubrobacteraceae bacterium]